MEFFKEHPTKESLDTLPYVPKQKDKISSRKQKLNYIQGILNDPTLNLSTEESEFLETFYDNLGSYEKLKAMCEADKGMIDKIIDFIPEEDLVQFYKTLGPERLKSLSYNITEVRREFQNTKINIDCLKEKIYSNFREGERYSKSDIKSILGKIYEDLEYSRTPKATDLERYFELRACQVPNKETGKRDNGFEIIKKKDQ